MTKFNKMNFKWRRFITTKQMFWPFPNGRLENSADIIAQPQIIPLKWLIRQKQTKCTVFLEPTRNVLQTGTCPTRDFPWRVLPAWIRRSNSTVGPREDPFLLLLCLVNHVVFKMIICKNSFLNLETLTPWLKELWVQNEMNY